MKSLGWVLPPSSEQHAPQMVPVFLLVKREMDRTVVVTDTFRFRIFEEPENTYLMVFLLGVSVSQIGGFVLSPFIKSA